jgi:hypothetical protein
MAFVKYLFMPQHPGFPASFVLFRSGTFRSEYAARVKPTSSRKTALRFKV